jgi:hypothetical protein
MKTRLFALFVGAVALLSATAAEAHSLLINPPPLTSDDNAKSGPCGCYFGAAPEDPAEDPSPTACPASYKVTDLVAGTPLQVTWKETVQHTGKFRVAFSDKPIDTATRADMDLGVLYEAADTNGTSGGIISATITVPNKPCQNCVIQMRQYMEVASTPYYYSCAAVNILPAGGSSSGAGAGAGAGGAGGATGTGGAGGESGLGGQGSIIAGPAPIDQPGASGYCSMSSGKTGDTAALGFFMVVLGSIAARRKRTTKNA